jgi:hypothetical protein
MSTGKQQANASPTPIHLLKVGDRITPRFFIDNSRVKHWSFAPECDDVGGGMVPFTAHLRVVEISRLKLNEWPWIKVEIEAFDPPRFLKISAQEYVQCFAAA